MDPSKDQSAINLPLERLVARALSPWHLIQGRL